MRDAGLWLKAKQIDQWSSTLRDDLLSRIQIWAQTQEIYLVWLNGEAAATFRITWEDESWTGLPSPQGAGYIHGLAVLRKFAGQGLGRRALRWAVQAIAAKGKIARLDCVSDNPKLIQYYRSQGFVPKGENASPGHSKVTLLELDPDAPLLSS
jgi:ribosomal protein S18 acetylase RimI-like enzyme